MQAEANESTESYETNEEEFAQYASECSDTDSSVPKAAEVVDLEADLDPAVGLDKADGSVISRKRLCYSCKLKQPVPTYTGTTFFKAEAKFKRSVSTLVDDHHWSQR